MGDPYYDPYQDMSDGDMINQYAQMNPQLFGNDPAKRLNYFQDLMSTLGTDLVQTAGVTNPAAEQYVEPLNQTGAIYGNDPLFASVFQSIEEDNDPISAAKAARDQGLFKGTAEDFTNLVDIATKYAGERVQNQQARAQWEAENGGGWSMPDGSKYKQTPLGGNDVRATASEYELMGSPDPQALFDQYVQQNGTRGQARSQRRPAAAGDPVAASLPMTNPGARIGTGDGQFQSIRESNDPLNNVAGKAGGRMDNLIGAVVRGAPVPRTADQNRVADAIGQAARTIGTAAGGYLGAAPAPLPARLAGGNFFLEKAAKDSINNRVEQSKNTMVRSDANRNLMRRITALAGLLQGGFPE